MTSPVKLCIECEHYRERPMRVQGMAAQKIRECRGSVNVVTGERANNSCVAMRDRKGQCGPTGKLFEAREDEHAKVAAE